MYNIDVNHRVFLLKLKEVFLAREPLVQMCCYYAC